jgi:hypothetical protein
VSDLPGTGTSAEEGLWTAGTPASDARNGLRQRKRPAVHGSTLMVVGLDCKYGLHWCPTGRSVADRPISRPEARRLEAEAFAMDPFVEQLARVALDAAGSFGFALAGGYAPSTATALRPPACGLS